MEKTDLSIVIVSYNVSDYLMRCLRSIYENAQSGIHFEIIVVDNQSKDDTILMIRQNFDSVILIENKCNAGFSRANNQGFAIAKGEYIMMLNPDTEVTHHAIDKIINYLKNNREPLLLAPRLLNSDGSLQESAWRFPKLRYILAEMVYLHRFIGSKYYRDTDLSQTTAVDSVSGAAIAFHRETLAKVGPLNENLFWSEDVDFCYRARKNNIKVIYLPEAEIIHHIGQSSKKNYNIAISNQIFSKIKFFRLHYSKTLYTLLIVFSFIHIIYKLIIFSLFSFRGDKFRAKARAYLFTLKGFLHSDYL